MADAGGEGIGVNYGTKGNNLPTPEQVVGLYKSRNIGKLRLFDPNPNVLNALHGSGIQVIVGTVNGDVQRLATDASFAESWVQTNIVPHAGSVTFRCVSIGNEIIPSDVAQYIAPAMQNVDRALKAAQVTAPVSTAVSMSVMGPSPRPSVGVFSDVAAPTMSAVISFLAANNYPLLLNAYPYYAYDPKYMKLDYVLLNSTTVIVHDGNLGYTNMLHAMVDTVYTAMEKVGGQKVEVVLSETGWPWGGGPAVATVEYAKIHNNNAVRLAANPNGTPKRPGKGLETYLFAMFNENLKNEGIEQHYGLYYPDMNEVYHVDFP
ncbi:Glycosyl hydrolases family 17 [Musa troglodytarum]|nr:Glycosyl hydrolases family 17 [Musa troglodytarum]